MENKKFSTRDVLMALMGIAIVVLFVMLMKKSSVSSVEKAGALSSDVKGATSIAISSNALPEAKIAYINIDTLNERYLYISDYVKVMKKKKDVLESQLQILMNQFQQDYETFQQSAQAGIAPQTELEKQKRKLEQQQKEIQNKQMQMDNLAVELQEKNEHLQRDIKEFMKKFNNGKYDYILSYSDALPNVLFAKPEYNITKVVLEALNEAYLKSKQENK